MTKIIVMGTSIAKVKTPYAATLERRVGYFSKKYGMLTRNDSNRYESIINILSHDFLRNTEFI